MAVPVARAVLLATVPAHNLHEGGVQHAVILGSKGEGDGVGLEVGGTNALSA